MFCGHSFNILYPSTFIVPSLLLHFFSDSLAPGLFRMQTEEASGVEVLLAFRPPYFAHRLGGASATSGFPNP